MWPFRKNTVSDDRFDSYNRFNKQFSNPRIERENTITDLKYTYVHAFQSKFNTQPIMGDDEETVLRFLERTTGGMKRAREIIEHYFKMKREDFQTNGYSLMYLRRHYQAVIADLGRNRTISQDPSSIWVKFEYDCIKCFRRFEVTVRANEADRDHVCRECLHSEEEAAKAIPNNEEIPF